MIIAPLFERLLIQIQRLTVSQLRRNDENIGHRPSAEREQPSISTLLALNSRPKSLNSASTREQINESQRKTVRFSQAGNVLSLSDNPFLPDVCGISQTRTHPLKSADIDSQTCFPQPHLALLAGRTDSQTYDFLVDILSRPTCGLFIDGNPQGMGVSVTASSQRMCT